MTSVPKPAIRYGKPRRNDWRARLMWWHAEAAAQPGHVYGKMDCALTLADAAKAMTDHDFASGLRGKYLSMRGAQKLIDKHGGLAGLMTSFLGEPIPPNYAQTGDAGLFKQIMQVGEHHREVEMLCIVFDDRIWYRSEDGLVYRSRSVLEMAWPVGRDP